MAFNHALRSEKAFDFVAHFRDIPTLLQRISIKNARKKKAQDIREAILDALRQSRDTGDGDGHMSRSVRPGSGARHISGNEVS
jgi:hypothetical protein